MTIIDQQQCGFLGTLTMHNFFFVNICRKTRVHLGKVLTFCLILFWEGGSKNVPECNNMHTYWEVGPTEFNRTSLQINEYKNTKARLHFFFTIWSKNVILFIYVVFSVAFLWIDLFCLQQHQCTAKSDWLCSNMPSSHHIVIPIDFNQPCQ